VSVGAAPVTGTTPARVAEVVTGISHTTFVSGMHAAFLVGAGVALAGALIAVLVRRGTGAVEHGAV
jgi:predicted membrane metal-binding protein